MIFNVVVIMVSAWITYHCYKWIKDDRQKNRERAERLRMLEELRKRNTHGK